MGRRKSRVQRNIDWIEKYCRIPEGKDIGQPVKLRQWQKDWIRLIYGNKAGTRLAILSVGRKNAKTTFSAFLLLLHLVGPESQPNSQLFSAAQSREQAAVIFALAAKVVRISASLRNCIVIRDTAKQLYCPERGTLYRALSADVATAYGLSPSFVVHDELGQVEGPHSGLYEALETATGAQAQPLSVIISTQAPTDNDLLSILIDDAQRGADPRVVSSLFTAPKDADPFDEKTIKLANPAYGDFLNKVEVNAMAEGARRMPSREADFRNLVLNQRVDVSNPFIGQQEWERCGAPPTAQFDHLEAYGGLDLSVVNDLTAFVRIARQGNIWHVQPTFWIPFEGLLERSRSDKVAYNIWHDQGFLQTTPGQTVSYDFVACYLREIVTQTKIKKIAFDRYNFQLLKPCLIRAGFSEEEIGALFIEFGQGYKSMTPALLAMENLILSQNMAHGNHPVLSFCANNAVVTRGTADERKLDKKRSRGRIDGMVALAMACSIASMAMQDEAPHYQMFFV